MIIVPNARIAPVEQAQPQADPRRFNVGDAAATIGAAAADAFSRIDDQNVAAELREARVAAAERLGAERLGFDQAADWTGLSARWEETSSAIGRQIGEGLSPRARAAFDLSFRELRSPHTLALQEREFVLRRGHERARLTTGLERLTAAAAGAADPGAAAAVADQTADTIEEARAAGWVSAEEAAELLSRAGARTANALALRLMREDPNALDARLAAGDFDALGPETVERYRSSAQAAVAQDAERAAQRQQQAQREAQLTLARDVEAAVGQLEAGLTPEDLEPLLTRAQGTPEGRRLETAVAATRAVDGVFGVMSPARQAEALQTFRSRPSQPGDEEVVAAMERLHAATIESVAADPLGHVARRGIVDVAPVDLSDPASVAARVATAEAVATGWAQGQPVRYFTDDERRQYAARLRDAGPEDQLALAVAMVDGFGGRAPDALGELGLDNPAFGYAGSLVALTGDDAAARSILAGQRLLDQKQGAKPKAALRDGVIAELVADVTAGSDEMRRLALLAADAHFADVGARVDPTDEEAVREAYADSVQAAFGGVRRGGRLFGGVQPVNDRPTILPASLTGDAAERMLGAATAAQLAAASLGGAPTWGDGRPVRSASDLVLIYEGGGSYLLARETSDGLAVLSDATAPDGRFRLDLARLARAVGVQSTLYDRTGRAVMDAAATLGPAP
jgi:hypothetical protein